MANGYAVCPACGCVPVGAGQGMQPGPWQGSPMWAGPAWGGPGGGQMMAPAWGPGPGWGYGAGWGAGPGWGYGAGPAYAPAYYGGLPTDSEIEEMIYDSIDADPLIPFDANIDVSVEAGTVYLRGEVTSKRIKHAAGDDTWWQPGVVDVHNEIKVTPQKRPRREGKEEGQQA